MPAGLSKMINQEVTSSVEDAVGHLLCRGGRFWWMDGSSKYCYVLWKRAHLLNMPLHTLTNASIKASSPTLGTKNVTQD